MRLCHVQVHNCVPCPARVPVCFAGDVLAVQCLAGLGTYFALVNVISSGPVKVLTGSSSPSSGD